MDWRPTDALSVRQPYVFILNFWQRYASHATTAPEARVANKGHIGSLVAKLCFPIGKIILQGTIARKSFKSNAGHYFLGLNHRLAESADFHGEEGGEKMLCFCTSYVSIFTHVHG